jgi:hypothetical protein
MNGVRACSDQHGTLVLARKGWPAGDEPTGLNDDEEIPANAIWKDSIRAPTR